MITLLFDIIMLIMPFLMIWLFSGCIAVWLHYAETVREGMAKIGMAVFKFFKSEDTIPPNNMVQIPDYLFEPLTSELKPHFSVLILLSVNERDDVLNIVYRQNGCNIGIDIVEIIYRKFLENIWNLNMNESPYVHVYATTDEQYLYLYAGISAHAQKLIQQERNNRISRQQSTVNKDIIE